MKAMTAKEFDTIQPRDLENSAVRDAIRIALEEREQQQPIVTEKEICSAIYAGRNWDDGKYDDKDGTRAVIELFVSKGFRVVAK